MTTTAKPHTVPENGETVFIPLNKLKKHPKNARKTPHSEASIEAKAASIAAKGILQNLVVEPELDAAGEPTGYALVYGITKESVPSEIWRQIFCIVGGGCVGIAAWMRLAAGVGQPAR